MTKFLKRYSNQKIKRFLFFLVVAGLFWMLTKFSREFTSSMQAYVNYQNLPETAVLSKDNPQKIHFDLTANGFEILFYRFKKPVINIPVDQFYDENIENFIFPQNEILLQLEAQFNKYFEVRNISPDPLKVELDAVIPKKVKVYPQIHISFRQGFNGIDDFQIIPDSVVVSGPKASVEKVDSVFTQKLELKDIHKNISEVITVELPSDNISAVNPEEILIEWEVAEFSQEQFLLPIEIINLPPGLELKLVPENIQIKFNVSLHDFTHIDPENFKVVCDYSKRNKEQNFMIPELIKKPDRAVNISMDPKKVDFFIFKSETP